jgi:hypothetical protein
MLNSKQERIWKEKVKVHSLIRVESEKLIFGLS